MIIFTVGVVYLLAGDKMWYPDEVETKLGSVRYIWLSVLIELWFSGVAVLWCAGLIMISPLVFVP